MNTPDGPAVRTNLVANPSFEVDTAGWEGLSRNLLTEQQSSIEAAAAAEWGVNGNCNFARSTAQALFGTASISMTAVAAGDMSLFSSPTDRIKVVPGQVFTAAAYFRAATAHRATFVRMHFRDATGATVGTVTGLTSTDHSAGWTQASVTAQAPANARHAFMVVGVLGAVAGEVHYVDAAGLFETPNGNLIPNPDFESGTTGWAMFGGSLAQDTTRAFVGRSSLRPTGTTTGGDNVYVAVPVTAGRTYTVTAYFMAAATAGRTFRVYSSQSSATATSAAVATANAWQRVSHTWTATVTGDASLYFALVGAAEAWNLDAVQFVVGSAPETYLPPTTHNLVSNPSFEDGGTTRSGDSSAALLYANSALYAFVGTKSLEVTWPSAQAIGTRFAHEYVSLLADVTYTFSLYYSGNTPDLALQYQIDGHQGQPIVGLLPQNALGTFTRAVITFKPTVSGLYAMFVGNSAAPTAARPVYFDGIQVELGSVATPYVDGSLGAGYAWNASENLDTVNPGVNDPAISGQFGFNAPITVAHDTTQAWEGTGSALITWPAATYTGFGAQAVSRALLVLHPGETRTYSFYYRLSALDAAANPRLHITGDAGLASIPLSKTLNTWTRAVVTVTNTTATAYNVGMYVVLNGGTDVTTTVATTMYVDAFQVENRPFATRYGNPGTANASTSTRRHAWLLGGTGLERILRAVSTDGHGSAHGRVIPAAHALLRPGVRTVLDVAANTAYSLSLLTQGETLRLRVEDSTGAELVHTATLPHAALKTNRHAWSFVTSGGSTFIAVTLYYDNAYATPVNEFWLDAVLLEQSAEVLPYFDGDFLGARWAGTPHASRSETWFDPEYYSITAERLYGRLPDFLKSADARNGLIMKKWISSVSDQQGEIDRLISRIDYWPVPHGGEPGDTSDLADATTADADWLDWLGQLFGVRLSPDMNLTERRDAVQFASSGFRAGTKEGMAAAAKSVLTGTRYAAVYDHSSFNVGDGGQWDVMVVTRASETPDPSIVLRSIIRKRAKPAGVLLWHRAYSTPWDDLQLAYPTWNAWDGARDWNLIEERGLDTLPAAGYGAGNYGDGPFGG